MKKRKVVVSAFCTLMSLIFALLSMPVSVHAQTFGVSTVETKKTTENKVSVDTISKSSSWDELIVTFHQMAHTYELTEEDEYIGRIIDNLSKNHNFAESFYLPNISSVESFTEKVDALTALYGISYGKQYASKCTIPNFPIKDMLFVHIDLADRSKLTLDVLYGMNSWEEVMEFTETENLSESTKEDEYCSMLIGLLSRSKYGSCGVGGLRLSKIYTPRMVEKMQVISELYGKSYGMYLYVTHTESDKYLEVHVKPTCLVSSDVHLRETSYSECADGSGKMGFTSTDKIYRVSGYAVLDSNSKTVDQFYLPHNKAFYSWVPVFMGYDLLDPSNGVAFQVRFGPYSMNYVGFFSDYFKVPTSGPYTTVKVHICDENTDLGWVDSTDIIL